MHNILHNRSRLFFASSVALIASAMTFAIRGDIMAQLGLHFQLTKEQVGWVAGAAFWGPTLSVLVGGQLCDLLGMQNLLRLAFLAHGLGIALTIMAPGFWVLWAGTLSIGLANGLIEAAINPLVATLYPEQKTHKLNVLHAWFPGGIVVGGLVAFACTSLHFGWQIKMAIILLPTITYGLLFVGTKFPSTERVQLGVSTGAMYRQAIRPQFLVWVVCMILTASTELGPNQWIPDILTSSAQLAGILVLVWINGLMTVGRLAAGPVLHRLSPVGLLIGAAGISAAGLFWLSTVSSPLPAFAAATVFAIGICYFWPTMLGVTAERFPAGGALVLGIMGAAGNLSVAIALPIMGRIYDTESPQAALRSVVILPLCLIVFFTAIWISDRKKGRSR